MFRIITKFALTLLISTVVLSAPAKALSVDFVDNATFTTDTISGLDWLDITASTNMTFVDVITQMGSGGAFDGWRFATGLEFLSLASNWTGNASLNNLTISYLFPDEGQPGTLHGLQGLLGDTGSADQTIYGFLADTSGGRRYLASIRDDDNANNQIHAVLAYTDAFNGEFYDINVGSFLVRDTEISTIPLPASLWMFLAALGGLGIFGWRKKKSSTSKIGIT